MPLQAVDSLIQKHYMWKMSEPSVASAFGSAFCFMMVNKSQKNNKEVGAVA
jgi:hypothetical protein